MSKRLEMTDELRGRIAAAVGSDVDTTKLVAFEVIAANTLPLDKRGSIFHGGVIDASMLAAMAGVPSQGGVPLHNLHMQGAELPVGRVFYAQMVQNDAGRPELRAQFYVPASDAKLVEGLDTATIDEVSVGVRPKELLCSTCNWDYNGSDASLMNILDQCCANGHTIGKDGNHVVLKGLDRWMELSLVSRGAANRPKIVGRTKALLGADRYGELIAAGKSPEATTLYASATNDEEATMNVDVNKLVADLSASAAEVAVQKGQIATLTASETALKADNAKLTTKVAELEAAAGEPGKKLDAANTEMTGLKAAADETKAFLVEQLKASWTAAGRKFEDKDIPADNKGLVEALKAATDSVHKLIPVGGRANGGDGEGDQKASEARLDAFKSKK